MTTTLNIEDLDTRVQDMYRAVAQQPDGDYHFETGRGLAEHLVSLASAA